MKKTAISLLLGAMVLGLSACGGGSSDSPDTSAMTIAFTPSTNLTMSANSTVNVDMVSSVRSTSSTAANTISSMSWTLSQVGGTSGGALTLTNAACPNINVTDTTGECSTVVSVTSNVANGQWNLTGSAKSSNGQQRSQTMTITIDSTNFVVNAGTNQSVVAQSGTYPNVNLNGEVTGAVSSDLMTYTWTQTSGPAVSLVNPNSLATSFTPSAAGSYVFQLSVKDTITGVTQTSLTTVVANNNALFVLNAGNSQSIVAQSGVYAAVTLPATVTGTEVANTDVITYAWTQTSGPSITLANANNATASFVPSGPGTYIFQVVATDVNLNASQTSVTTVVAN